MSILILILRILSWTFNVWHWVSYHPTPIQLTKLLNSPVGTPRQFQRYMQPLPLIIRSAVGLQRDTRWRSFRNNGNELLSVHEALFLGQVEDFQGHVGFGARLVVDATVLGAHLRIKHGYWKAVRIIYLRHKKTHFIQRDHRQISTEYVSYDMLFFFSIGMIDI